MYISFENKDMFENAVKSSCESDQQTNATNNNYDI